MPPFTYKRKRNGAYSAPQTYQPRVAKRARTTAFRAGRDRVGGFYGRYAGRSGELKFHDVDLDDAVVAGSGTVTDSINKIAQGVTESQRVGRKCTLKAINWRYQLAIDEVVDNATPAQSDSVRIILYLDKQCNGATAAVTDILESDDFQSFRNLANSGRFVVLMDRVHTMNELTLTSTQNADTFDSAQLFIDRQFYKKCNIPLEFSSTTGAITEIRSNNIGVLLVGLNNVARFGSKFRLRFSDS